VIGPTGPIRVMVATKPVDFRKGAEGLAALVRETMASDPFSGAVYVFRAKRADRIKLVFWDGTGLCLFVCSPIMYIHTTPLSASVEGFSTIALLSAAARSARRFYRLHCLRGGFDSGTSYR
jgi:transposase